MNGPVIIGRNLTKSYGTVSALAGVDIAIQPGQAVAAMGPSGSGKSTLLQCLAGIDVVDGGEVHFDGVRIDRMGERARTTLRRRRFGFVFQSGHLLAELPAEENVALPLMLEGMTRGRAVAEARRWFAPLGIDGLETRLPGELSGGQAQRVTIARALVGRPSMVFADEPTAALDRRTGHEVIDLLITSARSSGAGLLMVTHDPEVAGACDDTMVLRDGSPVLGSRLHPRSGPATTSLTPAPPHVGVR